MKDPDFYLTKQEGITYPEKMPEALKALHANQVVGLSSKYPLSNELIVLVASSRLPSRVTKKDNGRIVYKKDDDGKETNIPETIDFRSTVLLTNPLIETGHENQKQVCGDNYSALLDTYNVLVKEHPNAIHLKLMSGLDKKTRRPYNSVEVWVCSEARFVELNTFNITEADKSSSNQERPSRGNDPR